MGEPMTPEAVDLGRRLVALGGRFVVPDALDVRKGEPRVTIVAYGQRVTYVGQESWRDPDTGVLWRWVDGAWLPDVYDAATGGVVLRAVREAWGREDLWVRRSGRGPTAKWSPDCVGIPDGLVSVYANTEPAALVAALEAACRT